MTCDQVEAVEPDACERMLDGQVAVGASCAHDVDCSGPAYCKLDNSCPGTCTERGQAGADCDNDDQCATGNICHPYTSRCTKIPAVGDPCGGGAHPDCPLHLMCAEEDADQGVAGTCREFSEVFTASLGESCDVSGSTLCDIDLVCAFSALTTTLEMECAERVTSGAACKLAIPGQCPDGEYCDIGWRPGAQATGAQDFEGMCKALPRDGQPCSEVPGAAACAGGHVCDDSSTCRAIGRIGGSCASDAGCYSGDCQGGVCVGPESCEIPRAGAQPGASDGRRLQRAQFTLRSVSRKGSGPTKSV